ncbi:MAG: VCBS repeat-containing protein [Oscillospiraceae bacterium]|nr:VCBS repeat-containing protein [Oscillospiraceae bacterium]
MKRFLKTAACAALAALLCLLLTGCFGTTAEELYRLPRSSERGTRIQRSIDERLDSGLEFSAPVAGYNRQAIQQYDLDGDGIQEVIAFFRTEGEAPLEIDIIREENGEYRLASQIFGEGRAVDSVQYTDMDGDGVSELLVGWQMSTLVKVLDIYSVRDYEPVLIAESAYSSYICCDMNAAGGDEVLILKDPGAESAGEAVLCTLMEDGEIITSTAALSREAEAISRVQSGETSDRHTAVFVDSMCGGGLVTDVLAEREGTLYNVVTDEGAENTTARPVNVYCSDIDRDGVMEIPDPRQVYSQSETPYYVIYWKTRTIRGFAMEKLCTYHNFTDGWYLVLPEELAQSLSVRRLDSVSGERTVVLSTVSGNKDDPTVTDILAVYTLTGDNKAERAAMSGRFLLADDDRRLFAASILSGGQDLVTEEQIGESFSLIRTKWLTGTY